MIDSANVPKDAQGHSSRGNASVPATEKESIPERRLNGGLMVNRIIPATWCILICAAIAFFGHMAWADSKPTPTKAAKSDTAAARPLGVDELMKNVDKYPGSVTVKGVVRRVWADRKLLAVVDSLDHAHGHKHDHGNKHDHGHSHKHDGPHLTLPVMWSGPPPLEKDTIIMEGRVEKRKKGLIFVARTLKKVPKGKEKTK